jgi:hypothetical protein
VRNILARLGAATAAPLVRASIAAALPAAYFCYVFQVFRGVPFSAGLGDWIDPYLINVLLEHWHHSLWHFGNPATAPMYFPAAGTLGYSVGLILYAPFYLLVRPVLHPFQAYTLTLFLVMELGSLCLYQIFRRFLRLGFVEALLLCAFFFTSANVVNGHSNAWAQTLSVFLIPPILLLTLVSWRMAPGRRRRVATTLAGLLITLIFTQDFYTGIFALLLSALVAAGTLFHRPGRAFVAGLWTRDRQWLQALATGAAIGGGVFLWIYLPSYREHPTFPADQLIRSFTRLYPERWHGLRDLWQNVRAFSSQRAFALVLVAGALVWLPWFRVDRRSRLYFGLWFLVVSFIVFVIPLRTSHFSLWRTFIAPLPGFAAIRDPKRIIFTYELVVVLGAGVLLARLPRSSWYRRGVAALVFVLLVTDWNATTFRFDRPNAVFDRWVAAQIAINPSCRSFFIKGASAEYMSRSGHLGSLYGLDASFIALAHSIPTLNGYTAWSPPGWGLTDPPDPEYQETVTGWIAANHLRDVCELDIGTRTMTPYDPAARVFWGDVVPGGWRGSLPPDVATVPELTAFTRTMTSVQLLEFIAGLKAKAEGVHVLNMFTSPRGRIAPAIVLSRPRVTSADEARASGKPVIFLLGNTHPSEPDAAEALLMVARDLALGRNMRLLDNQIVVIAPILNIDGTDSLVSQNGSLGSETPRILGVQENAGGFDLNLDAVKLQTVEAQGLYRVLNDWDPALLLDGHLSGRVSHGYANTYGTTTVPAASPGPRTYTRDTLFPAVRQIVRHDFGLEVFTHGLATPSAWPPTAWSYDRAGWTVDARSIVNDFGLRNRLSVITETPGQPTFERRMYAQYAYILSLLDYTNSHAKEIQAVVKAADDETVAQVTTGASAGRLKNWLDGEYRSGGTVDLLAYRSSVAEYRPGTSVLATKPGTASGKPEVVHGVDDLTESVGTRDATVPRGYLIPAGLTDVVAKLRLHNVKVRTLNASMRAEGETFTVEKMRTVKSSGADMTVLDGRFSTPATVEFPAGTFYVDMAQPMANAAFYYLEPQARDGFVGWGVLDEALRTLGAGGRAFMYPIFKVRREVR